MLLLSGFLFFTMSRYNDRDAHLKVSGWEMNE